jgi:hypothetical protein
MRRACLSVLRTSLPRPAVPAAPAQHSLRRPFSSEAAEEDAAPAEEAAAPAEPEPRRTKYPDLQTVTLLQDLGTARASPQLAFGLDLSGWPTPPWAGMIYVNGDGRSDVGLGNFNPRCATHAV